MPLQTNKTLLVRAKEKGYAVGAFNINNLEILQAIVFPGEAEKSIPERPNRGKKVKTFRTIS